jgi:deazaflavin-dependent oxidoreductase (nitroreductase family)
MGGQATEGEPMTDVNEWNRRNIEEFRANEGKVGGNFEGQTLLLLHHTGAKTGTVRVNPLVYQPVGDAFAVFASKGGAPTNPDWFHNLVANPNVTIEVGTDTFPATARVAGDEERAPIWEKQKANRPTFAKYEEQAGGRTIPVVLLEKA